MPSKLSHAYGDWVDISEGVYVRSGVTALWLCQMGVGYECGCVREMVRAIEEGYWSWAGLMVVLSQESR